MRLYYYCELEDKHKYVVRYSCKTNKSCDGTLYLFKDKEDKTAIEFIQPSSNEDNSMIHWIYSAMWNALEKFGRIPTTKEVAVFY